MLSTLSSNNNSSGGATLVKVSDLEERCSMWRYRCPLERVQNLQQVSSIYSDEFVVAGVTWRLHLQQRIEPQSNSPYLALHLQYLGDDPQGTFAHFKLTCCNNNPDNAKEKTFHCHFKKHGSAWGLHHFIRRDVLLDAGNGFIDYGDGEEMPSEFDSPNRGGGRSNGAAGGRRHSYGQPAIIIDVIVRVLVPDREGRLSMSHLPPAPLRRGTNAPPMASGGGRFGGSTESPPGQQQQQLATGPAHHHHNHRDPLHSQSLISGNSLPSHNAPPNAQLQFPYDDTLCDMAFAMNQGVEVKAHRCVIAARCPKLLAAAPKPLKANAVIEVTAIGEVFKAFLRYVYTEETPERGVLRPEYLIDLYVLAQEHDLNGLAEACIIQVHPLLTHENILQIVTSRYNPADEVLTALYLGVLYTGYDHLIEDEYFETLPGALNRKLALIVSQKEKLPQVRFPPQRTSLSAHLGMLAESGPYSDFEIKLDNGVVVPCHKFVLASRSLVFNQALYERTPGAALPDFSGPENCFTETAWKRFVASLYRATLDPLRDVNAEDVALVWKMSDSLGLDGRIRRESESYVTPDMGARLMVYAEKHDVAKLKDVSLRLVATGFGEKARSDPEIWKLIGELSKDSVLNLFRTVTVEAAELAYQQQPGYNGGGRR